MHEQKSSATSGEAPDRKVARLDADRLSCIDPEQLAAYLDGGLRRAEIQRVEAHLEDCDDCRAVLAGTVRVVGDLEEIEEGAQVAVRRRWWTAAGLAGVAATLSFVLFGPAQLFYRLVPASGVGALASAVGAQRPTEGRLAGGFRHGPLVVPRSSGEERGDASPEVVIAVARIEQALARNRDARTLNAFGAAQLVLGRVERAVAVLEESRSLSPDDWEAWVDLSAAYLEAARRVPAEQASLEESKAVQAATRATQLAPHASEAWFNLALAQQRHGEEEAALRSWREYLGLERDPGWKEEGRRQLAALEGRGAASVEPYGMPIASSPCEILRPCPS
jgi:tetratricopeptide (TPR) repeat protein